MMHSTRLRVHRFRLRLFTHWWREAAYDEGVAEAVNHRVCLMDIVTFVLNWPLIADPIRRRVLDALLAYDRNTGYSGTKFNHTPDSHCYPPRDRFEGAVRNMQGSLDRYGLHRVPGMSDGAHKEMYEQLRTVRRWDMRASRM